MLVVTAGTAEYRPIIDAQARKCVAFGYRHMIFDLGGLGIGEPYAVEREDLEPTVNGDSLPPATFKAALVEKAFAAAGEGELVCWLDADCIPLREFMPLDRDGNREGFDAAVTLRPAPEVGLSNNPALDYLNSGVVWIRNNAAGKAFREQWQRGSEFLRTDQGALNVAVGIADDAFSWNAWRGKVVTQMFGARVLVLDAMEWNCWHFPPPKEARILHFKGGIRYLAKDYLNR